MNTPAYKPVVLLILDGFGEAPAGPGNATTLAQMTNYRTYANQYPHGILQAGGTAVGLEDGEVGSTEVGHLNIGAGRIVLQDLPRINAAITDNSFFQNEALIQAMLHAKTNNSHLHIMGLASEGHVHSSLKHLYALLKLAVSIGLSKDQVKIHAFTDGRDTSPTAGLGYIAELEQKIREIGMGEIASIAGRYYAMDRDNRWDRIEKEYRVLTLGQGMQTASAVTAVKESYEKGITDEFIVPTVIVDQDNQPKGIIQDNDAVIFFNFRTDRARQLTKALTVENFEKGNIPTFSRGPKLKNLFFTTMTEYERNLPVNAIAFPQEKVNMPLSLVLSNHFKRHLHIAETEKERFTTFFFNGMREDPFPGEERIFIPSPKVPTYDLQPEMSSFELTEVLLEKLNSQQFDFAVVNFACPDMVGHTGNLAAAVKACEAVDECLGKIVPLVLKMHGAVVITADHGNCEQMLSESGEIETEHSPNPVPVVICADGLKISSVRSGSLPDIAPTVLALMDIPKPLEMTGKNLLI